MILMDISKKHKQHFGVTTSTFRTVIEKYGMDLSKCTENMAMTNHLYNSL